MLIGKRSRYVLPAAPPPAPAPLTVPPAFDDAVLLVKALHHGKLARFYEGLAGTPPAEHGPTDSETT